MVGETNSAMLWRGRRQKAAPEPGLGVGTGGNKNLLGEEEGGEEALEKRQEPEQRLRNGTDKGPCTIKERRKVTVDGL